MLATTQAEAAQILSAHAACKSLHRNVRDLTASEVELIAEAVKAGASVRRDSGMADYLNGEAGLPVSWGTYVHCEDYGDAYFEGPAAAARAVRDAFHARITDGDLTALATRVLADRSGALRVAA